MSRLRGEESGTGSEQWQTHLREVQESVAVDRGNNRCHTRWRFEHQTACYGGFVGSVVRTVPHGCPRFREVGHTLRRFPQSREDQR